MNLALSCSVGMYVYMRLARIDKGATLVQLHVTYILPIDLGAVEEDEAGVQHVFVDEQEEKVEPVESVMLSIGK